MHADPHLDMYNLAGEEADCHLVWKALLEAHPDAHLLYTPRNEGHWIALRGDAVHEIYGDAERFSSRAIRIPKSWNEGITMLPVTLDPPEHTAIRAIINPNLSPRAVLKLEPLIRQNAARAIDAFCDRGECEFVAEYAQILPMTVFMDLVDLPMADVPMLKKWATQFSQPTDDPDEMSIAEVMQAYAGYLKPYILARRENPGSDLLSRVANGARDGRPLTIDEAIDLLTTVMIGGLDTVFAMVSYFIKFLAENSDHRQQLLDDPGLIPGAVDELLRRYPLVANTRLIREDINYRGVELHAGEVVLMPTMLQGLDEHEFADPMTVDFHRAIKRTTTFGNGSHRCPGAFLARSELRITLEEWLKRIPHFEIAPGAKIEMRSGMVINLNELPLRWPVTSRFSVSRT